MPRTFVACIMLIAATAAWPAPIPTLDGHPDLNGNWDTGGGIPPIQPVKTGNGSVCLTCAPGFNPTAPVPPPPPLPSADQPLYKPEFRAKVLDLRKHQVKFDTSLHCRNPGVPRIGPPQKIVQSKDELVFLYADLTGESFRLIPVGRPHRADVPPSYLGDSVAHWEGNVLVVDDVNFNDETWLADDGLFHSAQLHVIERLHRDGNTLHYQATVYDPKVLMQPWVMQPRQMQLASEEMIEAPPCVEEDFPNMTDETYHHNAR